MERVQLAAGFVLHGRPWRETSELLEVLTGDHGRISLVARGMRRPKSRLGAILQPFQPVSLSWSGRGGGLMTLTAAEPDGPPRTLQGEALMSAFYLNELLLRFLHKGDPHPDLFVTYAQTLGALATGTLPEIALRRFEMALLAESGYGLMLEYEAATSAPLDPHLRYEYRVEEGPVRAGEGAISAVAAAAAQAGRHYTGANLLAIARGEFEDPDCRASARQLLRAVLDHHLGSQPLRTRAVYAAMRRSAEPDSLRSG